MKPFLRRALALSITFLFFGLAPCRTTFAQDTKAGRYNLLIVMVNCLDKNHVPPYGYSKSITPNLTRFSQDAYIFKNLVSAAGFTPPVVQEFFRAAPTDRSFFLEDGWSDKYIIPTISDYPLSRFFVDQGYDFFNEKLPDQKGLPFVSFLHLWDLHCPYDLTRRRAGELHGEQKKLYRKLLSRVDEIELVDKPSDPNAFSAVLQFFAFDVRRTEIPVNDEPLWDSLLKGLKETGDSPAALIAAALPTKLSRRLSKLTQGNQLTLRDKAAIVKALNRLTKEIDSPIGKFLFGPDVFFKDDDLIVRNANVSRWGWEFSADITRSFALSSPIFKSGEDGRLSLNLPLSDTQRPLLRQIYRETLEFMLPALTLHHSQNAAVVPPPGMQKIWRRSSDYKQGMALLNTLYDANVAHVDRKFGEFLNQLKSLGLLDETIVVFMGDHGEALMEHGQLQHGGSCFDEEINPPLLIRIPGRLAKTAWVETQLRTGDVLPTLVDLMGLHPPTASTAPAGVSLAPALDGATPPDITAFSRSYDATRSVRTNNGWKLIWEMGTNNRQLYNLKSDPHETHDLAEQFPDVTAQLEEKLNRFLYGD